MENTTVRRILPLLLVGFLAAAGRAATSPVPLADTGPNFIVAEGSTVTLDASGSSDPSGGSLAYIWAQVDGPEVTLRDGTSPKTTFTVPMIDGNVPVLLSFELLVQNGAGRRAQEKAFVVVTNINRAPVADAGPTQTLQEGAVAIVDASRSSDPDQDNLRFLWSQVGGPEVMLSNPRSAEVAFVAPPPSPATDARLYQIVLEVQVEDGYGGKTKDTAAIAVLKETPADPNRASIERTQALTRAFLLRNTANQRAIAHVEEAEALLAKGDPRGALRACERALILSPSLKSAPTCADKAQKAIDTPIKEALDIAKRRFREKNYFDALRSLQAARKLDPYNLEAAAYQEFTVGALEQQAFRQYRTRVVETVRADKAERDIDRSRSLYNQGLILYANGKLVQAREAWKKACALDQENKLAFNALSRAVRELESE